MRAAIICSTAAFAAAVMSLVVSAQGSGLSATASLTAGTVTVSGSRAVKSAVISWEGTAVTTAGRNGGFAFSTSVVPPDCIGTVSDGTSSMEVSIAGCSAVSTGLPGTGQRTIYAVGDDGYYQAGGALTYTDNGDQTVTDHRTGLTWEKKTAAGASVHLTWEEALAYVAELNAMDGGVGFAGHNDWRLPNVKELLSIIDYGRFSPSIDPIFGPTLSVADSAYYWSSTSWAAHGPADSAWGVNFADSLSRPIGTRAYGKHSFLLVRAVRGGL